MSYRTMREAEELGVAVYGREAKEMFAVLCKGTEAEEWDDDGQDDEYSYAVQRMADIDGNWYVVRYRFALDDDEENDESFAYYRRHVMAVWPDDEDDDEEVA